MTAPPRLHLQPAISLPAGRPASVLVLLYPHDDDIHTLLTQRTEDLQHHRGQISFPGGASDPTDADHVATALREAFEEVGLRARPAVLGFLPPIYIRASGFAVAPCVGWLPERPRLAPQQGEVAALLEPALQALWSCETMEDRVYPDGTSVRVPSYPWRGHRVWGATARILQSLRHAFY